MVKRKSQSPDVHALLQDGFSEETARQLYARGEEIAIFVMMQLAALAKKSVEMGGTHPSEPSGTVATYLKEPGKKRKRKPGAKPGHKGSCCPEFSTRSFFSSSLRADWCMRGTIWRRC